MGNCRFLYNNLITDEAMITVSSLRPGFVSAALKEGSGAATMYVSGNYTGTVDVEYIIEIDSVAGGVDVGQATFKWTDGGGSWDATGVTTSATAVGLNNGVYVNWAAGWGSDFVLGDRWYCKGINLFSAGKMIELDRDTRYRSSSLEAPNTVTIDLGGAETVQALVIYDHNFTSGAVITLEGDDAATFDSDVGNPQYTAPVAWCDDKIIHYLSVETRQYWRLKVSDLGNPADYLEIGEIYLGGYLELSRNFVEGFSRVINTLIETNATRYGIRKNRFYNRQSTWSLNFAAMPAADVTSMIALMESLGSRATGIYKPFWVHTDAAVVAEIWLVEMTALPINHRMLTNYDMPIEMVEVVKSA